MSNVMEKFWKRWIEANHLDRLKIIERMVEKRGFDEVIKMDKRLSKKNLAMILNGYFEDLAYVVDAKVAKESNKEIAKLKEEIVKTNKLFKKLEEVVKGELREYR